MQELQTPDYITSFLEGCKIAVKPRCLLNFTGNRVLPEIPVHVSPDSSLSAWDNTGP